MAAVLNRNVTVLFIGDSTTAGVGADPTGITDVNGSRPYSVPLKAKDWLNSNGVAAIAESVAGDNNVGTTTLNSYRPDVEITGTTSTSSRSPTMGGVMLRRSDAAAYINFTTSIPVDTVRFAYPKASGFGTLQLLIDNVAHSTYSGVATSDEHAIQVVTGLSLATHKIGFSTASGTAHGPALIQAWDSSKNTVQIINAGARNWKTSDWVVDTYPSNPKRAVPAAAPDVTVIDIGINDYRQSGTTIATATANIQSIINSVVAVGSKVILVVPNGISGYNTATDAWSQSAVLTMYQGLAASNPGVVLIDAPAVYYAAGLGAVNPATHASLSAAGYMYDSFHPKAAVYEAEGNAVGAAIKDICTSNGWLISSEPVMGSGSVGVYSAVNSAGNVLASGSGTVTSDSGTSASGTVDISGYVSDTFGLNGYGSGRVSISAYGLLSTNMTQSGGALVRINGSGTALATVSGAGSSDGGIAGGGLITVSTLVFSSGYVSIASDGAATFDLTAVGSGAVQSQGAGGALVSVNSSGLGHSISVGSIVPTSGFGQFTNVIQITSSITGVRTL